MAAVGWNVDPYVERHRWREIPWASEYDAVIVRSTWDYQDHLAGFLEAMAHIADAGRRPVQGPRRCRLFNDLDTLRWNATKSYLRDIARVDGPKPPACIIPTLFLNDASSWRRLIDDDVAPQDAECEHPTKEQLRRSSHVASRYSEEVVTWS